MRLLTLLGTRKSPTKCAQGALYLDFVLLSTIFGKKTSKKQVNCAKLLFITTNNQEVKIMRRIILMFLANLFRLPYMLFMVFHANSHREKYNKSERYAILHRIVRWANWGGRVNVKAFGLDNLPKQPGYIMYPNHQGLYDTLTMLEAIDTPFSPIAKIETKSVFLLHNVIDMLDGEYIDRSDIRQSLGVINSMSARAKKGESFVIFAEGTRSKKGNEMNEFKPGAFKAALLSHAPIVPVALVDCFIPFDHPSLRKVTVQAHFLEPIYYDEYKDMKTPEISSMVQERIRQKIAETAK